MKRRDFLSLSAILALSTCFISCKGAKDTKSLSFTKFSKAMPIPQELNPPLQNGVKKFELNIKESSKEFFDGINTQTYGIDASYLGPTLRLINGERVEIKFNNKLSEETTMHGHGMHVPASMDGGPHQKIIPNSSWTASYTVKQKSCTNWYHPHLMGETARQVYQGLAGFIIVDDSESLSLDLPKRYGVDDFVVAIQERRFTSDGSIDYSPSMMETMRGYKGDYFLANGEINPYLDVEAKEIRFRLLNASNSSVYNLQFDDNRAFYQIATDNSFLPNPIMINNIRLSPGERAEIVVDFTNDLEKEFILKDLNSSSDIFQIRVNKTKTATTTLPNSLTSLDTDSSNVQNTRNFVLDGSMGRLTINGVSMDMNVINETIPLNQLEIWNVTNNMMVEHNFHIHATHFVVLERNGSSSNVLESEKGYKDTVYLASGDNVKLLVKMTDYSDANTPYMYHCHFLEHEDNGMMGQFVVS